MRCDKRDMTLSVPGCVTLHKSANQIGKRPEPWEGRFACYQCPVGAAHRGVQVDPFVGAVERLRKVCVRCAKQTDRIILGTFCPSCYNRKREVERGRNGKGAPPSLAAPTGTVHRAICVGGEGATVAAYTAVTSATEVALLAARRASGPITIGLACPLPRAFRPGLPAMIWHIAPRAYAQQLHLAL